MVAWRVNAVVRASLAAGFFGTLFCAASGVSFAQSSSTTIRSSLNPSQYGQSVTFTARVSGSGGAPAGTLQFRDGGAVLGGAVAVNTLAVGQSRFLAGAVVGAASVQPWGVKR